jgi:hypothetical protein
VILTVPGRTKGEPGARRKDPVQGALVVNTRAAKIDANDPSEILAAPNENALDVGFYPYSKRV